MASARRMVARVWTVAMAVVTALTMVGAERSVVRADLLDDFVNPPHVLDSVLPTPLDDPFYIPPPGFEKRSAGTVLASRAVRNWFPVPVRSIELLVRSTNAKGEPVPVVATLLTPQKPWSGTGSRPLVSYNIPISSLGNSCAPSRQLQEGVQADQLSIGLLLARDYAVVVPDHQGPRQAYAAGRMGGHAVLDALRAVGRLGVAEVRPDSPIVMSGYSGGAIATGWAAQLAGTYAPELPLVGSLIGGVPADYDRLRRSMDGGTGAAGIFLAAALGLAREYPELLTLLNDNGWRLAHAFKDLCVGGESVLGLLAALKVEDLTDVPDPTALPMVRKILADNRLGAFAPKSPALIYHGVNEFWIPFEQARNLYDDWCGRGARVRLDPLPGEHFVVGALAIPATGAWVADLFAGRAVPPGCSVAG
ncbi:lipase family protein [Nocardia wallacei]|uniref:lipase family protein n=1 Tax=Nocardia wallacei TaxID=480035 RepID=UPI00245866CB|nr:lipase family protein [Nocardia wallacei]